MCPTMNPSLGYGLNMFHDISMLPSSSLGQMRYGYVWMGTSMNDCQVHHLATLLPKSCLVGNRCWRMCEFGQLSWNRASYDYIYTCIFIYIHAHVHVHVHIYIYIHTDIHIYMYTYTYTKTYTYTCTYTYTYRHIIGI